MSQLVRHRSQLSVELPVVPGKVTIGADHRSHQHRGPTMGTAVRPAKTSPGPWDAFADVDAFVDEGLVELEAMAKDGSRPIRSGQSRLWPERCCARPSWRSGASAFAACSGGRSDS